MLKMFVVKVLNESGSVTLNFGNATPKTIDGCS